MSEHPIRVMAYRHSAFYSPLIACIVRFLKLEGAGADYFVKPKDRSLYDMFRTGEVEIMQAAVSTSWDPLSKGIHDIPRHFALINQRDGFFIVARRPGPFTWTDLEGAELVADHSQQPLAMLKYGLNLQGVDWNRIKILNEGPPETMESAFRSGRGDYVHLQGPAPQILEEDGVGYIVACLGDAIPPVAFSTLMAMPSFLESSRAALWIRAYRRALEWVNDAPAAEIAAVEHPLFPAISETALTAAISTYQRLGTWRHDLSISRDQYETAMKIFRFNGIFKQSFPYESVVFPLSKVTV